MKVAGKRQPPRKKAKAPASRARLPILSLPVLRGVAADPWQNRTAASNGECAACIQACSTLGGHLRPLCEALCLTVCTR